MLTRHWRATVPALILLVTLSAQAPAAGATLPTHPALQLAAAAPMPAMPRIDCSGYREKRVFLEVQAWWRGPNTPNGIGHLHAGTCFPLGQRVSGRVRFDVRIIMHNNPGHLFSMSSGVFGGSDTYVKLDRRCKSMCVFWVRTSVDTRTTLDGWHEFRFKARVRYRNGNRMITSTGWPALLRNGKRSGDENRPSIGNLQGRGWYERHGYQAPDLRNARDALRGPISGIWRPEVRLAEGGGGSRPSWVGAYIDPDFHTGYRGLAVFERGGPYIGPLRIDTTKLADGWHKLVLRVTAQRSTGQNSGIQVVYFHVNN